MEVEILVAIITAVVAVLVALINNVFGITSVLINNLEGISSLLSSKEQKLTLWLFEPKGELTRFGHPYKGPKTYFYHIKVKNQLNRMAKDVGVKLTKVNKANAGGDFPKKELPNFVNLKWADKKLNSTLYF